MGKPTYSTNAFNNVNPARGQLADAISKSGVLTGVLGGAAAAYSGDRVKLDTTNTVPGKLVFVAAADNEAAVGCIKSISKQDTYAVGDTLEVTFSGGQVMYHVSGGTLTPGTPVALSSDYLAAVDGAHLQMGLLIDYCTQYTLGRVIMGWVAS
jgi:hypothetical protein